MKTVEQVKQSLNPELIIHGIVLTMYDSRNNLSAQVVADVREFMGRKVYDTVIPRNVRISEAPSYGKPVLVYDLKCAGSEAYLRLATEIIQREKELLAGSGAGPAPAQPGLTVDTVQTVADEQRAVEAPQPTEPPPHDEQTNAYSSGNEQTGDQPNNRTNNFVKGG
jgi:hypothetical protein